jgi:hypothetical protein
MCICALAASLRMCDSLNWHILLAHVCLHISARALNDDNSSSTSGNCVQVEKHFDSRGRAH